MLCYRCNLVNNLVGDLVGSAVITDVVPFEFTELLTSKLTLGRSRIVSYETWIFCDRKKLRPSDITNQL